MRNSDGWKLNEPNVTHALASLIVAPTPGHERQHHAAGRRAISSGMANRLSHARYGMRIATIIPTRPIAAHDHLAVEDVVRAVALGGLDASRRRQHHHQAEHHEHGDDDDRSRSTRPAPGRAGRPRSRCGRLSRRRHRAQSGRPARRLVAAGAAARAPALRRSATDDARRVMATVERSAAVVSNVIAPIDRYAVDRRHDPPPIALGDEPPEVVAAGRVAALGVPVEAGAPRRQQHDVAGPREPRRRGRRRRPSSPAATIGAVAGERLGDHVGRLADRHDGADALRRRRPSGAGRGPCCARRRSARRGRTPGSPPTRRAAWWPWSR